MDYTLFLDLVIEEEEKLSKQNVSTNYRLCKALAACYELQDYLANCIADIRSREKDFAEDKKSHTICIPLS